MFATNCWTSFALDRLRCYGRPLSIAYVLQMLFLWPPYALAQVNGGSQNFYTWWTSSVNREVTTWIFSWSSLNYRVGQKVTKFGIFSDHTRKLSASCPNGAEYVILKKNLLSTDGCSTRVPGLVNFGLLTSRSRGHIIVSFSKFGPTTYIKILKN